MSTTGVEPVVETRSLGLLGIRGRGRSQRGRALVPPLRWDMYGDRGRGREEVSRCAQRSPDPGGRESPWGGDRQVRVLGGEREAETS